VVDQKLICIAGGKRPSFRRGDVSGELGQINQDAVMVGHEFYRNS
jgi:hypothetical protein